MDTTVGAFNCEYRAAGGGSGPGALELDHDLRSHFSPALADGVDLALAGDPTVYAIRRLDCEVTLRGDGRGLPDLARRTAAAVTNAILRALSEDPATGAARFGASDEIATFADEAEFVAQFVVDLLEGRAQTCWYYASFRDTLARPRPEGLASVLSASDAVAMRALGRIYARGYLERLLAELPASAAARLCAMEGAEPSDESFRPLVGASLMLASEVLSPGLDYEQLLREYAGRDCVAADWGDRGSLAEGVLHALRFLLGSGRIALDGDSSAAVAGMLARAAALDWLDTATLVTGIERLTADWTGAAQRSVVSSSPSAPEVSSDLEIPAAPPHVPARLSSRQRLILRGIAAACSSDWPGLEVRLGDCPSNRLRLHAALMAHDERWAGDPVAGELIGAVLRELARGAGTDRPLLHELAALGVPGAESSRSRPGDRAAEDLGIHSETAGVALLIRAALDIRVGALASAAEFMPPRDAVCAAVMALARAGSTEPDPGLSLILESPMPSAAEESPRQAFETGVLRTLAARGMLVGAPRVGVIEIGGITAVFGGIERPALWPFAEVVGDPDEVEPVVARWREQWCDATGESESQFARLSDDRPLAQALAPLLAGRELTSPAELTMIATGLTLVRVWAHWLPGVGRSSLRYLLDHFILRPGTVCRDGDEVRVVLERRDLDTVLELSGALASIDARRSLGVVIHFELTSP
jgi:hypothetical protein